MSLTYKLVLPGQRLNTQEHEDATRRHLEETLHGDGRFVKAEIVGNHEIRVNHISRMDAAPYKFGSIRASEGKTILDDKPAHNFDAAIIVGSDSYDKFVLLHSG